MVLLTAVPVFIDGFFVDLNNLKKITRFVHDCWYILVRSISNICSTKRKANLNKEREEFKFTLCSGIYGDMNTPFHIDLYRLKESAGYTL